MSRMYNEVFEADLKFSTCAPQKYSTNTICHSVQRHTLSGKIREYLA